MCNILVYLRSTEELADDGIPSLVAFITARCHGLDGNLFGEDSPWHAAGVCLGQVVQDTAGNSDVAASLWLHPQLSMEAMKSPLELAYCPAQCINRARSVILLKWFIRTSNEIGMRCLSPLQPIENMVLCLIVNIFVGIF